MLDMSTSQQPPSPGDGPAYEAWKANSRLKDLARAKKQEQEYRDLVFDRFVQLVDHKRNNGVESVPEGTERGNYDVKKRYWARRSDVIGSSVLFSADDKSVMDNMVGGFIDDSGIEHAATMLVDHEQWSKKGIFGKAGDIVTEMPAFMASFLLSGGLTRGAAKSVAGMVGKATERAAARVGAQSALKAAQAASKNAVVQGAKKGFVGAAQIGVQTAAQPKLYGQSYFERISPKINVSSSGDIHIEDGDDLLDAIPTAFLDAYIETGTEHLGYAFNKIPALNKLKSTVLTRLANSLGIAPAKRSAWVSRQLRRGGYNGIFEEFMEERAADIARGATGLQDNYGVPQLLFDKNPELRRQAQEQVWAELIAFSLPAAGASFVDGQSRRSKMSRLEGQGEINRNARDLNASAVAGLSTKEFADAWAAENPESAKKMRDLAGKEYVSRKDLKDAGLGNIPFNVNQRKQMVDYFSQQDTNHKPSTEKKVADFFNQPTTKKSNDRGIPDFEWSDDEMPAFPESVPTTQAPAESSVDETATKPVAPSISPGFEDLKETITNPWDRKNRSGRNEEWSIAAAESNPSFVDVEQEGSSIPSHGMAKASTLGQGLEDLISLLNNIDPGKTLNYAPLTAGQNSGAGVGTAGGHSYRDGPFVVTFKEGLQGQPTNADITGVLVNPANAELVEPLQKMFPNLTVRDYNGVADVVAASKVSKPVADATTPQTVESSRPKPGEPASSFNEPAAPVKVKKPKPVKKPAKKPVVEDKKPAGPRESVQRVKSQLGYDITEIEAKSEDHKAAIRLIKSLGHNPVLVQNEGKGRNFLGAYDEKTNDVIVVAGEGNAFWRSVGHEIIHATGIDKSNLFSDKMLKPYIAKRMRNAGPQYRAAMEKNPGLQKREGSAMILSEFFENKEFREKLFKTKRPVYKRITEATVKVLKSFKFNNRTVVEQRLYDELTWRIDGQARALEAKKEFDKVGIEINRSAAGWTVKGLPQEQDDGLRADFRGRRTKTGHFFELNPTRGLVDIAKELAEEAEQSAAAEASGLVRTRIGSLTPENAREYEEIREERIALLQADLDKRNSNVEELLGQFVPKSSRSKFKKALAGSEDHSGLKKYDGGKYVDTFDAMSAYARDHTELELPGEKDALFDMLKHEPFVAKLDPAEIAAIDEALANELSRAIGIEEDGGGFDGTEDEGDASFDFRASAGGSSTTTISVLGINVPASAITAAMGVTTEGKALIQKVVDDAAKSKKWSVGIRTINEYIVDSLHSRLIVAQTQLSRKHPGLYRKPSHTIFSKSGISVPINIHEAGHALMEFLKDTGKLPKGFAKKLTAFADINQPPDGFASAVNAHEGMAEMLRLWVTDPMMIPKELREEFESVINNRLPGTIDTLGDARLAFHFNLSRPFVQQATADINDSKRKRKEPEVSRVFHAIAQEFVGPTPALAWHDKGLYRRATTGLVGKSKRSMQKIVREIKQSLVDTPADIRAFMQMTFHVPNLVSQALYGTDPKKMGTRIHQNGNGIHDLPDAHEAIEELKAAGFDIPEFGKHGDLIAIHDQSLEQTKVKLGDQWEQFNVFGQYKTVLHRLKIADKKGEYYNYPKRDTHPPDVLKRIVREMRAENPEWESYYKEVQKIQDQLLLIDVLSGERSVSETIQIKREHVDYWTLPRHMENLAVQNNISSGSGSNPTSGVRRQYGSELPFIFEPDGIQRKITRHISAYYDIAAKTAMLRTQQQMRSHKDWKQLPFAARKFIESTIVPLKMDLKVAAKLNETELRVMAADAINNYLMREARQSGEVFDKEMFILPEDVEIDELNKPIFRQTPPKMANVISTFDVTEPGVRKYFYVPDRIVATLLAQKGIALPDKLAWIGKVVKTGSEITRPFKENLVQTLAFAIRNLPRDAVTGIVLAETWEELIPGFSHLLGFYEHSFGKDAAEMMASELVSHSLPGVHHEQHEGVWGSFRGAMEAGIKIPKYSDMDLAQRISKVPGQVTSAYMIPITFINWATGGRYASSKSEIAGRAGSWKIARNRGQSPMRQQLRYDVSKGNFTQHSRTALIAETWRMLGFANPVWQLSWQMYEMAFHPDPKVRTMFYTVKLPVVGALGAVMAAATVVAIKALIAAGPGDDDEKKEKFKKWADTERNRSVHSRSRYMHLLGLKLPFEYGVVGAIQSASYVVTMDLALDGKIGPGQLSAIADARTPSLKQTLGDFVIVPMQVKTLVENLANYKFFFDVQVVDQRLLDEFPNTPELQTWPDTPEIYKAAGRVFKVSPEVVRHSVRGTLTSLGDDVLSTISRGNFGDEPSDWPLIGRLMPREARGFSSRPVQDLKKLVDEQDELLAIIEDRTRRGVDSKELVEQVKQLELARMMNTLIDDAWKASKKEFELGNAEAARENERQMTDLAARFFDLVEGKTDNPGLKEKLHLSIVTAISRMGTLSKHDGESKQDFDSRKESHNERLDRLFAAQEMVAGPLKLQGRLTSEQNQIKEMLMNAVGNATTKPSSEDKWSVRWAKETTQFQLLKRSGISYAQAFGLLRDWQKKKYGKITPSFQDKKANLQSLYRN